MSVTALSAGYVIADAVRLEYLGALEASDVPVGAMAGDRVSESDLAPVFAEAQLRWAAAGLEAWQSDVLAQTAFVVQDLGGTTLALASASSNTIYIDDDAAGFGWFIDTTIGEDEEFALELGFGAKAAEEGSEAYGKMDLLTAVLHEMGHLLGKADLDADRAAYDLMADQLESGVRRTTLYDAVFAAEE